MKNRRKTAVVTGTRADYGLLRHTIRGIRDHDELELALVVTGAHLSHAHGSTVTEIERDGFEIAARLPILKDDSKQNTRLEMARSLGVAVSAFVECLSQLQPELLVLFGDRYEMLAAAQSALLLGIPIAHIAGGERSEGAVDEAIRHSITKMSRLHLVSTDSHRRRVLQLGEQPETVITVGALVLDSIAAISFETKTDLCARFGFDPAPPLYIATLHAETLTGVEAGAMADNFVTALSNFTTANILLTGSNADAGGDQINARLRAFADANAPRVQFHNSLGQELYLKVVKVSDAVLGNSSSGVIEAPILAVPSVNIGARQQGRMRSATVVDSVCEAAAIINAVHTATSGDFRRKAAIDPHPFGSGAPARLVVDALAHLDLHGRVKRFHDY